MGHNSNQKVVGYVHGISGNIVSSEHVLSGWLSLYLIGVHSWERLLITFLPDSMNTTF